MALPIIRHEQIPEAIRGKLQQDETVHHFGYIDAEGGCGCSLVHMGILGSLFPGCAGLKRASQWLMVTNKRILFEASVKETSGGKEKFVLQTGSIPMSKVSYVGTATSSSKEGSKTTLRINSSGGEIILAIPTKEEAERAQGVIDEILSTGR
jgi:hypothetical protein